MADKGFDLKVLIPTDDGLTISENGIKQAMYYLLYNVSNRSYQFAGKIKTSEFFNKKNLNLKDFNNFLSEEGIDTVLTLSAIDFKIPCEYKMINEVDISTSLNQLIDEIEQKKS